MSESIKETLDRLHGVGAIPQWKLDTTPRTKLPVEEMKKLITKSKEELQNREKGSRIKHSAGNESSDVYRKPCSQCGATHWNIFPDGRKMCLKCNYLDEKTDLITCEFSCSGCPEVIQAKGKDIEAAMKKIIPHKLYDPTAQCEGVFKYSRQVFPHPEPAPIPETDKIEKPTLEQGKASGIIEHFQHPKLGKFVCNYCRDMNSCSQTSDQVKICLLISIDLKLKKLVERPE